METKVLIKFGDEVCRIENQNVTENIHVTKHVKIKLILTHTELTHLMLPLNQLNSGTGLLAWKQR